MDGQVSLIPRLLDLIQGHSDLIHPSRQAFYTISSSSTFHTLLRRNSSDWSLSTPSAGAPVIWLDIIHFTLLRCVGHVRS
jgi:hypothetical protein